MHTYIYIYILIVLLHFFSFPLPLFRLIYVYLLTTSLYLLRFTFSTTPQNQGKRLPLSSGKSLASQVLRDCDWASTCVCALLERMTSLLRLRPSLILATCISAVVQSFKWPMLPFPFLPLLMYASQDWRIRPLCCCAACMILPGHPPNRKAQYQQRR